MPIYLFQRPDGDVVEREYSFAEVPPLFGSVLSEGERLTRIPQVSGSGGPVPDRSPSGPEVRVRKNSHFVSWSLPPVDPRTGMPKEGPKAPNYDMDPKSPSYLQPRFASRDEARRFCDQSLRESGGQGGWSYGEDREWKG